MEFCPPSELLERENYYIKNLKPEYNILQEATSSLGYKHSEQTLAKMSAKRKNLSEEGRQNLSKAATGRVLSDETKVKISEARRVLYFQMKHVLKFQRLPQQIMEWQLW